MTMTSHFFPNSTITSVKAAELKTYDVAPMLSQSQMPPIELPRTLFIGDMPLLCDEERLYELFSPFGAIESIQVKKDNQHQAQSQTHLSYGFVKFLSHEPATRALAAMNGTFVLGRRLRVSWAHDNPGLEFVPAQAIASSNPVRKTAQIHVLFLTSIMHQTICEMDLYEVFSHFGKVVDITIKKSVLHEVIQPLLSITSLVTNFFFLSSRKNKCNQVMALFIMI